MRRIAEGVGFPFGTVIGRESEAKGLLEAKFFMSSGIVTREMG
ncbi:MAG TPA: hypothetical protein VNM92_12050 [Thermoanaerobaculia bacterium]|nr:hypothetical protein [Thermoanaerobaculia bacterium]